MTMPNLCDKAIYSGIVYKYQENAQFIEVMGKTGVYWAKMWPGPDGKPRIICDMNGEMIENAPYGGIMIDIGAMHGRYSLPMASKADVVYSFEPHPDNFNTLREICARSDKIIPINKALSNKSGNISMFLSKRVAEHSLVQHFTTDQTIEVEATTLDKFFEETDDHRPITGIKIDVEGLEEKVLLGARKTLKKHNALISLETHTVDCSNIYSILTECGYKIIAPNGEMVSVISQNCQYLCRKDFE